MSTIQDMPPEILEQIILELDPLHIASLSQTCIDFATFIYYDPSNRSLWRNLYLAQPLDDPRTCITRLGFGCASDEIDWKGRLQRTIRARTVAQNPFLCHSTEWSTVYGTLLGLIRNVPSSTLGSDGISLNLGWVAGNLRGGTFFDITSGNPSFQGRQLRAELRTHFGLTRNDFTARSRAESRGVVYAMRNYRDSNDYGPYLPDGSGKVDWELMDRIHHVMSMHIVQTQSDEEVSDTYKIYPMSLPYCQSEIPAGFDIDTAEDWAGITGLWECSFCFCDHRLLLLYNNFNMSDTDPLQKSLLYDIDFQEAHLTIHVQLHVVSTETEVANPMRPTIHFEGEVEGQARMSGWVAVTPDNCVRWHFSSGEPGNPLWSSEGVQVGGVRSVFGVLGIWTTVQHDRHDPVGPFWMRKLMFESTHPSGKPQTAP